MPLVLALLALLVLALLTDGAFLVLLWQVAAWCWSLNPLVVSLLVVACTCGFAAVICSGRLWAVRLTAHAIDAVRDRVRRRAHSRPPTDLVAFPLPILGDVDEHQAAA